MYEENVRRGMQLLDHAIPDWLWRVDLSRLCLDSCRNCVIGQLAGDEHRTEAESVMDFEDFVHNLGLPSVSWEARYGFNTTTEQAVTSGTRRQSYKDLTATWRRLILEAREQRKLTLASQPLEAETERVLAVAN